MADDDIAFVNDGNFSDDEVEYRPDSDAEDDEDFVPNDEPEDDDDFALQGYDDYRVATPEHEDVEEETVAKRRSRPAFHQRSLKNSERSGQRVRFTQDEDSILLLDDNGEDAKPRATTSRVPGTFGRRNREKGSTLPAYHKKVTADLDSDDELMMDMREKGYSDRQIADRLAMEGRVRFDMKSIATRVYRIRTAQAQHVDHLLKEGYVEWKAEDDQLLMRAYDLAEIEIRYETERLRAWRFRKVSDYMRRLNKPSIFSAEACAERYKGLVNGTAVIPSEIDDDPDGRKAKQLEFVSAREREHEIENRAKEKAADERRSVLEEARARQAKKAAETAARREAKETEKTNRAIIRATKAQVRQQRASENTRRKEERKAQLAAAKRKREREHRIREKMKAIYAPELLVFAAKHSEDPRKGLAADELRILCQRRGLDSNGNKAGLLQRIQQHDKRHDATDLKEMCIERKIPAGTNKAMMRYQLALFDSRSFQFRDADLTDDEEDVHFNAHHGHHGGLAAEPDDNAILDFGDDSEDDESEGGDPLSDLE